MKLSDLNAFVPVFFTKQKTSTSFQPSPNMSIYSTRMTPKCQGKLPQKAKQITLQETKGALCVFIQRESSLKMC